MTKKILFFFGLSYLLTWVFTIPFVSLYRTVFDRQLGWWAVPFLLAPFGPSFAALILTARQGGWPQARKLLARLVQWRVSPRWYLFLLVPFALTGMAVLFSSFRGSAIELLNPWPGLSVAPVALLVALPFGPLPEELGWRGYALPRLIEDRGPWASSVILGVAWTFWHTPMFWFPGAAIPSFLGVTWWSVLLYLAQLIGISLLFTFLYCVTRGSVMLAVLLHLTFNTAETIIFRMLPDMSTAQELEVYIWNIVLLWLAGSACLAWLKRRRGKPQWG